MSSRQHSPQPSRQTTNTDAPAVEKGQDRQAESVTAEPAAEMQPVKSNRPFPLVVFVLRVVLLMILVGVGIYVLQAEAIPQQPAWLAWMTLLVPVGLAAVVIAIDLAVPRKHLDTITAVYIGLLVGLFLAYLVGLALIPLTMTPFLRSMVTLTMSIVFCYVCISLLLQTRSDFRFLIPYVEFARQVQGGRPYILDTSAVIDGRIADVLDTGLLDGQLVMPRMVISQIQAIAGSSERRRRARGRRGLDILNRLRAKPDIDLIIHDIELPEYAGKSNDLRLVALAKHLDGHLVTNDYNLNQVAQLHGVRVVNLNDLANALQPVFLPGETVHVYLTKPGERPNQGVGYLDDGTMVVVESGLDFIGKEVTVDVTQVLPTPAGRLVFGRCAAR